jgi:hypothetical protein
MLVLDANVAVAACAEPEGFADLGESELVAPPLMWSEFFSGQSCPYDGAGFEMIYAQI